VLVERVIGQSIVDCPFLFQRRLDMKIKQIRDIKRTAQHLLAVRSAALNMGCEHLLDGRGNNQQDAVSAAYNLWDGLASGCGIDSNHSAQHIVDEFNNAIKRMG
jgi:hypothetical protein